MPRNASERLRGICLAMAGAAEVAMKRGPTYRIGGKIFAMDRLADRKAPIGSQAILVQADPTRFFAPPYVGPKGWIGIWLDGEPDWTEVRSMIERSYNLIDAKATARARSPRRAVRPGSRRT
jgi:predicted DNA-binding protein (MmcQ/YjbR family)